MPCHQVQRHQHNVRGTVSIRRADETRKRGPRQIEGGDAVSLEMDAGLISCVQAGEGLEKYGGANGSSNDLTCPARELNLGTHADFSTPANHE